MKCKFIGIFVLLLSICGITRAQPSESGKPGAAAAVGQEFQSIEWLEALPDGNEPFLEGQKSMLQIKSDREQELDLRKAQINSVSIWKKLEALSDAEKDNSFIQLEVTSDLPAKVFEEMRNIEIFWSKGNFNKAVEKLRAFEESNPHLSIAVGISWKVPKTTHVPEVSSDGADVRIGIREDVIPFRFFHSALTACRMYG